MLADKKTITRRCIDFMHKYATNEQIEEIARILNISTESK